MSTPTLLFLTGSHGDEYESGLLLQEYLREHAARLPSFFVIPKVSPNPVSLKTRKNKHGHDINRQFFDNTKDAEAKTAMQLLVQHRFQTAIDIHEDPDRTESFYLYDSFKMTDQELTEYRSRMDRAHIPLFTGIDDPEDDTLDCEIDQGYYYFRSLENTEGFFSKWAIEKGIVKRVFTVEIPGAAPLDKKRTMLDTILPFLVSL